MEFVMSVLITGIICIICFYMGYKAGKHENIKINPQEKIQEIKEKKNEKEKIDNLQKSLSNLDDYNGNVQKEIK